MSVSLAPSVRFRGYDNNNVPLVGGKLFTYAAGSTTKQATYTDSTGNTQNTNPIILDSRGEADVWVNPILSYKFVLSPAWDTDPPAAPFWTKDNLTLSTSVAAFQISRFVYGGGAQTFTLAGSQTGVQEVYRNGILVDETDWSISGAVVTIGAGLTLSNGDIIRIRSAQVMSTNVISTVANLPSASGALKGNNAFATDLSGASYVFGAVAAGGGTRGGPVFCDGTNWREG